MSEDRVTVTISGLIKDTEDGLKRQEIATKYNLTLTEVRDIFKHPKLKDVRAKAPKRWILVDDTEDGTPPIGDGIVPEAPVNYGQAVPEPESNV
jgi:hypothetical protein